MARKKTTAEFIADARKVHGDRYDYRLVEYKLNRSKVEIGCAKHGAFQQTPNSHLRGSGCPKCGDESGSGKLRESTGSFVAKAKGVHGDRYDYTNVKYTTSKAKVEIVCKEHGPFKQVAASHLGGTHCPSCTGTPKRTTAQFIVEAKRIHGDLYDYSKVNYTTAHGKVDIICEDHGLFTQKATIHLRGSQCPACRAEQASDRQRLSTQEFVAKAREVHGERYDYSQVNYTNATSKVEILCAQHGAFQQVPNSHLTGCGCPQCAVEMRADKKRLSHEQFVARAWEVHGHRYDYSNVTFARAHDKVRITCKSCELTFKQSAWSHLSGTGCASCAQSGFNVSKPAQFYYARIDCFNQAPVYLIGITNRTFEKRYRLRDRAQMTLLHTRQFDTGQDALGYEKALIREHAAHAYTGPSPLDSKGGETSKEMFTRDILGLDRAAA
jgi:predicted nucleic-acid-binding Zn-ribbon protein